MLEIFLSTNKINGISVIKIDVEGSEPLVINGAINTINSYRPALLIEITDSWFKSIGWSEIEIREKLKGLGYGLFVYGKNNLLNITNSNKEFLYQYNLLAIPE